MAKTTIPAVGIAVVYVDAQLTEPLLMSPFIFGSPDNKADLWYREHELPNEHGG